MNTRFEPAPEIASYQDVPMIRRRWFFVASFACFIPAAIGIALTGPIYAKTKEGIARYSEKSRRRLAVFMTVFMAIGVAKIFLTR